MSVDKSLRLKDSLTRHRNVLTRAQRIEQLVIAGKFVEDENSPFGLPKVRVIKIKKRGKKKEEKDETEDAAAPETPAAE